MRKVRIAAVGLGRLGLQHAGNLASLQCCELVAVCDPDAGRARSAAMSFGCRGFSDFGEALSESGAEAVCLASPSALHSSQAVAALAAGKHVFCEKPLGMSVEECLAVEAACRTRPDLVLQLGFMRRFDPSYLFAKRKIDEGAVGRTILFRSYSQDPESAIEGAIAFGPHSGGEFFDMSSHDLDLARWMTGDEVESVWAAGGCYAHPEFARWGDGDNAAAMLKFKGGAMGFVFAGRTAPHGYNVETEIIGTKGILRIGSVPQKNLVEVLCPGGVLKECSQSFLERFAQSYLAEMEAFCHAVATGERRGAGAFDGRKACEAALLCKRSFESGAVERMGGWAEGGRMESAGGIPSK